MRALLKPICYSTIYFEHNDITTFNHRGLITEFTHGKWDYLKRWGILWSRFAKLFVRISNLFFCSSSYCWASRRALWTRSMWCCNGNSPKTNKTVEGIVSLGWGHWSSASIADNGMASGLVGLNSNQLFPTFLTTFHSLPPTALNKPTKACVMSLMLVSPLRRACAFGCELEHSINWRPRGAKAHAITSSV